MYVFILVVIECPFAAQPTTALLAGEAGDFHTCSCKSSRQKEINLSLFEVCTVLIVLGWKTSYIIIYYNIL